MYPLETNSIQESGLHRVNYYKIHSNMENKIEG